MADGTTQITRPDYGMAAYERRLDAQRRTGLLGPKPTPPAPIDPVWLAKAQARRAAGPDLMDEVKAEVAAFLARKGERS